MILENNDTIGIIALSGECDREKVELSKKYFETLGYKVKLSKNIFDTNRYLAGNDDTKVDELHSFFEDKDIKLILCARGGYGCIRLINKINYNIIKSNPKPFCGFSDITALLLMIYKNTGLVTYHSPMACSDFALNINEKTKNNFFKAICGNNLEFEGTKIYNNGSAEGILWGGNLATVVSLCGQDFIPDGHFLFFAEELNEPVYKIDKMFQQLLNIPQFTKNCKGIILGDFLDVDNESWLQEYFEELSKRTKLPVAGGFKITHSEEKITLPVGKPAKLEDKKLYIG
jgi:muramoyltetrapeptide carboxypeptidase